VWGWVLSGLEKIRDGRLGGPKEREVTRNNTSRSLILKRRRPPKKLSYEAEVEKRRTQKVWAQREQEALWIWRKAHTTRSGVLQ